VDPTLQVDADGGVSAKAHPRGLKLAGQSGDGDHDVVRLGSGDDAVALQWAGRLPKPVLDGTRATYRDVLDGVDLVIESTRSGYEQFFVVKTREALSRAGKLNLRFRAAGQTVSPDGSGGLMFKNRAGVVSGRMPQPSMWDAVVGEHSLDHLHMSEVKLTAAQRGANIDMQLVPDPAFLAKPDLTYPITIDPSVTLLFDTFVQTGVHHRSVRRHRAQARLLRRRGLVHGPVVPELGHRVPGWCARELGDGEPVGDALVVVYGGAVERLHDMGSYHVDAMDGAAAADQSAGLLDPDEGLQFVMQ
jgi:hypothetical protein